MTTKLKQETHQEFERRMTTERNELGRAIREAKYDRAAAIAHYILKKIQERRRD